MEHLLIERQDGWVRLVLNRPSARNALNTALLAELAATLDLLAGDSACRAVLLCGADGNFAAGADLAEIEGKSAAEAAIDPRKDYWARVRTFPKPLVAAIEGFALGGGLELALMADIIVVGPDARLGLPETNLGLIPGAGGTQRLTTLIGRSRAMRMILTGEIITAETAEDWGLAAYLADAPGPFAADLTARLAARAPLALMAAKAAVIKAAEAALDFAGEREAFEALLDSADKAEGIAAFRARRAPRFTGS